MDELPTEPVFSVNTRRGYVDDSLSGWLATHADDLNQQATASESLVPRLAQAGLFGVGVPVEADGNGGDVRHAALAIAEVAEHSLTAAFAFWGQRSFIEYLLKSPNHGLAERWLPKLLKGEHAGATGLSNAMKFLGGIESLQIDAHLDAEGWRLRGKLAWVTNLRKAGFVAAAAVAVDAGTGTDKPPMIVAFSSDQNGVQRTADLDLIALRGSNTAAVDLHDVHLSRDDVLHEDARRYLPAVRPAFLAMQCGMSIGLARASLREAQALSATRRSVLTGSIGALQLELEKTVAELLDGVLDERFKTQAAPLFRLRIRLAGIAQQAVGLELQTKGGSAYLSTQQNGFARRWTEAAFVPIITPSLTQLQTELQRHEQSMQANQSSQFSPSAA